MGLSGRAGWRPPSPPSSSPSLALWAPPPCSPAVPLGVGGMRSWSVAPSPPPSGRAFASPPAPCPVWVFTSVIGWVFTSVIGSGLSGWGVYICNRVGVVGGREPPLSIMGVFPPSPLPPLLSLRALCAPPRAVRVKPHVPPPAPFRPPYWFGSPFRSPYSHRPCFGFFSPRAFCPFLLLFFAPLASISEFCVYLQRRSGCSACVYKCITN